MNNLYKNSLDNIIKELDFVSVLKEVILRSANIKLLKRLNLSLFKDDKKISRAIKK